MIADHLDNLGIYIDGNISELIFAFINTINEEKQKNGEWIFLNTEIKAIILETSSFTTGVFEAHKIYRDIHIVLKGSDTIYLAGSNASLKSEYDETGDYSLFNSVPAAEMTLSENMFAIIGKEEKHSNQLLEGSRKIVVKIK